MTQYLKHAMRVLLVAVGLTVAFLAFYGEGYLLKAVSGTWHRGTSRAGPYDHQLFATRLIKARQPQPWPLHADYNKQPLPLEVNRVLQDTQSIAFLVIKDGKLLQERYWRGHTAQSISNSFSMAKPVVGMLLGMAEDEGLIHSLEDPVSRYLDGYDKGMAAQLKVVDLVRMTSGVSWDDPEVYDNPLSKTTRLYYGNDVFQWAASQPVVEQPGQRFHYNSANTVLAAEVLKKATQRSLSQYLEEKVWGPLGMEHDAQWMLDRDNGREKSYCCLSATARDFGKLGQFVLDRGRWNGKVLLSERFIEKALAPSSANYGYGFRMDEQHQPPFTMFRGIYGQMIIVVPTQRFVIVKLGHVALPDDPSKPLSRAPEAYMLVQHVLRTWGN